MLGKAVHGGLVVTPILHELGGQLNGVPLDAVDAGRVPNRGAREHVLQTHAPSCGKASRPHGTSSATACPPPSIAREVRHRDVDPEGLQFAKAIGHPRAAMLVGQAWTAQYGTPNLLIPGILFTPLLLLLHNTSSPLSVTLTCSL